MADVNLDRERPDGAQNTEGFGAVTKSEGPEGVPGAVGGDMGVVGRPEVKKGTVERSDGVLHPAGGGMHMETERKFLVKNDSWRTHIVSSHHLRQAYLAHDRGITVRVRQSDEKACLTVKGPSSDGISRKEWEMTIPLADAEELFSLCSGMIDKTRHIVPCGPVAYATAEPACGSSNNDSSASAAVAEAALRTTREEAATVSRDAGVQRYFEVDEFHGDNEGLVVAEIELDSPDEVFGRPSWLGPEVTGIKRYYNFQLSGHPYKFWG